MLNCASSALLRVLSVWIIRCSTACMCRSWLRAKAAGSALRLGDFICLAAWPSPRSRWPDPSTAALFNR